MTVCVSAIESATCSSGCASANSQRSSGTRCAPGPGGGADAEPPGQLAGSLVREVGEQLVLDGEQALGAAVEREPGLGRLDAAPGAVDQLLPDPLLERADLEADRGLGHPEPLGRLGEAAPLDDRAERPKLARIHKRIICMACL